MLGEWANSWEADAKETATPINPCVEVEWSQEWLEHLWSCSCSPKSGCPFCNPISREKFKVFFEFKKIQTFQRKMKVISKRYLHFRVHYCISPKSQGMEMAWYLAKDVKYTHTHIHTHTEEYSSPSRKKENLLFVTTWGWTWRALCGVM